MPTPVEAVFWEQDGALTILHTGVFATDEEVRHAEYGHHAAVVAASVAGKPAHPIDKIAALCRSYGLPTRDDGAHWAIAEANELVYAWPEGRPDAQLQKDTKDKEGSDA